MKLPALRILGCAIALVLAGCQTMPQKSASVPSPLLGEEAAKATELPADTIAGVPSPELAPGSGIRGAEVFARLQSGFQTPVCTDGERSGLWQRRYAGNPRVFAQHLQQILPMLDFVSREVQSSGLPTEFALIPLVESWYRPDAVGPGGPAGMWQMIGSTAKNHGVHIQSGYDGRLSPVDSTHAALSYLKSLHDMFNDWQATVMAYNAGEYRLLNAFERDGSRVVSGEREQPRGLSNITYDYVAKLQALSCLISEPQRHGLALPLEARFQPLAPMLVDEKVQSLDQVAARSSIDGDSLRRLNPGYRSGRIVAGSSRMVLVPTRAELSTELAQAAPIASLGPVDIADHSTAVTAAQSSATMAASPRADDKQESSSEAAIAAPAIVDSSKPDHPPEAPVAATPIAAVVERNASGESQLAEQNPPAIEVALVTATASASNPGADPTATPATAETETARSAATPESRPKKHQVRDGDTLWSVAKQYGVSLVTLRRLNGLGPKALLKPGQSLKLLP
jgi:membrane-bound lytic murein transglycosylase D